MSERIVVALGGNAILKPGQEGTVAEQFANVEETCRQIAEMIASGCEVVVTHGNGPQVGNILIQNECAAGDVPAMPLDVCGAESQGLIGYMIQRSIANELRRRGLERDVATVVTQVLVDQNDPAFDNPTKPIGPHYSSERAQALRDDKGYKIKETAHGWRRVVPSPRPIAICELQTVRRLVEGGVVVVASGGGGIPVISLEGGQLVGVEAVIDKDLAGQRLAQDLEASIFLVLTDVEQVMLDFNKPTQRPIDHMTMEEAERFLDQGQFPPGSMGPKVRAAVAFVKEGGRQAIITSLEKATEALKGNAGTVITR